MFGTQIVKNFEFPYDQKIDETDPNNVYVGVARPADKAAANEAKWKIKKISISGAVTTIRWADGVADFQKVWDNRATYTYTA